MFSFTSIDLDLEYVAHNVKVFAVFDLHASRTLSDRFLTFLITHHFFYFIAVFLKPFLIIKYN